jgi:cysteine synthase A
MLLTVATDGAAMYRSEADRIEARDHPGGFGPAEAAQVFEQRLLGQSGDHLLSLGPAERERVFNLGYFTWVEQRGVSLEEFEVRRGREFWDRLPEFTTLWDRWIVDFNNATGALERIGAAQ